MITAIPPALNWPSRLSRARRGRPAESALTDIPTSPLQAFKQLSRIGYRDDAGESVESNSPTAVTVGRVINDFAKGYLHEDLRWVRQSVLDKLDGLSEYDVRRPLTRTGTNLLGLVKHLTLRKRCISGIFSTGPSRCQRKLKFDQLTEIEN